MRKLKEIKGITLIALVITIVILLILAGIAISQLTENGLFNKTQVAKEKYTLEEEKEQLEIDIANFKMQMLESNNGKEVTLNDLKTYLDSEKFNGEYIVELFYEPLATTENVSAEPLYAKVTHVPTRFVFYIDGKLVVIGGNAEEDSENPADETIGIDTIPPQNATITISNTAVNAGETITATITHSDNESEIEIENCKYVINESSAGIGVDNEEWNTATAFITSPQDISITTEARKIYYIHVLSVDTAGNKRETISSPIRFKGKFTYASFHVLSSYSDYFDISGGWVDATHWYKTDGGGTIVLMGKTPIDVTNISKIILNHSNDNNLDNGSWGGDSWGMYFGLVTSSTDTNIIGETYVCNMTRYSNHNGSGTIDTSALTGQYYIKIMIKGGTGTVRERGYYSIEIED